MKVFRFDSVKEGHIWMCQMDRFTPKMFGTFCSQITLDTYRWKEPVPAMVAACIISASGASKSARQIAASMWNVYQFEKIVLQTPEDVMNSPLWRVSVPTLAVMRNPSCTCPVCGAIVLLKSRLKKSGATVNEIVHPNLCVVRHVAHLNWFGCTFGQLLKHEQMVEDLKMKEDES